MKVLDALKQTVGTKEDAIKLAEYYAKKYENAERIASELIEALETDAKPDSYLIELLKQI